jgi:uncharacterized protein
MIVEGVATTWDLEGRVNVAPLGPVVPDAPPSEWSELLLRPFPGSKTYANLKATREGVFHLTDDVLLIAKSAIGEVEPPLEPCHSLGGRRLVDCCQLFEFRVVEWDESGERPRLRATTLTNWPVRPWTGFNRAKHAVLEAAILATRIHLLGKTEVEAEFARLRSPVEKTAGPAEREAFDLLVEYVRNWRPS